MDNNKIIDLNGLKIFKEKIDNEVNNLPSYTYKIELNEETSTYELIQVTKNGETTSETSVGTVCAAASSVALNEIDGLAAQNVQSAISEIFNNKFIKSLDLSIDDNYVITLIAKDQDNTQVYSKTIDLPIESMIVDVDYNSLSKNLTLTLQNGTTVDCDIADIVSGLVPDTRKIAGFDLKDDITVDELKTALGGADVDGVSIAINSSGQMETVAISDDDINEIFEGTVIEPIVNEGYYTKEEIDSLLESASGDISLPDDAAAPGDMIYVKEVDVNGKPIAWSYSKPSSIEVYDTQSRTEFKSYTGTLNGYNFLNSENKVEHKAYRIDSSTILVDDVSHALNINDYILITSTENSNYCMIKRIDNENIVARFFVDKEMVLEKNLLVFEKKPVTIYGFHINSNESNPSNAVTYLEDAVGMTPAYMNYTTGQFDYGSWEDAFFMPRPCMLKSDGTVDYYLDPNDYSKKADGTASDIANTSYDGNAMMEWGKDGKKIWLKVVPDTNDNTSASIYIADEQDDDEYTCYNFVGSDGVTVKDHFYTPIYQGSLVSSKLRSLSGRTVIQSNTANNEVTYATANGTGWYTECWCDMELLQDLLVLISKSLDTQTSFGNGGCNRGSSASYMLATGTMNTKGLFWGSSSTSEGVKVFGMENLWGNQYRRFAGFVSVNGTAKIKKCFGTSDGSTTATYNFDGTGYKSCGTLTNSGGYLSKINFSSKNNIPIAYNGSSSTYYCDYAYVNTSGTYYAFCGGNCGRGLYCGTFYLVLDSAPSNSGWRIGAAVSYR